MDRACATYAELWGNVKEGERIEDLGTDRKKVYNYL
jgi:hypothetical protein